MSWADQFSPVTVTRHCPGNCLKNSSPLSTVEASLALLPPAAEAPAAEAPAEALAAEVSSETPILNLEIEC